MVMGWRWIVAVLVLSLHGIPGGSLAEETGALSQEEARGKRIFREGRSEAGRMITAKVGRSAMAMPGKSFPCASCHGSDGRGRPEGGVVPADITWSRLGKPLDATIGGERSRSAYDETSLERAITSGVNPDGVALDVTMPRFDMDREDMADLIAYVRRLEQDLDPGVTERTITLGTLVPKGRTPDAMGSVVAAVLKGYVQDVNEQTGIYNRRLELSVLEAGTQKEAIGKISRMLEEKRVFALVGAVTAGFDREMEQLTENHQVPLVGPLTQFPSDEDSQQRQTFYLFGGLSTQGRALLEFASRTRREMTPRLGIVYPQGNEMTSVASSVRRAAALRRWEHPFVLEYPRGSFNASEMAQALRSSHVDVLLFLGSDRELRELAEASVQQEWTPLLLISSISTGPALFDMPLEFDGRLVVAFPSAPTDHTAEGVAEFSAFQARHHLPTHHLAAQLSSYVAIKVLVEGLKRSGAELSRERLLDVLEQLYEFRTGLTPSIIYGPNRRIGASGAYVIRVELVSKRFGSTSIWVPIP